MGIVRADIVHALAGTLPGLRWRVGSIDRYLLRGVAGPFVLILPAVIVTLMLERALRLIREMAAGGADLAFFLPMLGQLVPYYFELAVPLAFLVALVLLVARLDQRLELEALLASGVSLARLAAPLVACGLVLAALDLGAGGWLEPHGRYGFRALRIEAVNAGQIGSLQPRALFQPSDDLVMTFDERRSDGSVGGVFMWQRLEDGQELVASGASGRVGFSREGRVFGIDLAGGRYVTGELGAKITTVEFNRLAVREQLLPRDARWERGWDHNELTLPELSAEARDGGRGLAKRAVEAEFYGRIVRAAIIPLIPLLVLPLAFATKRRGRALGVLVCGAFVVLANHGLNFARSLSLAGAGNPALVILGAAVLVWLLSIALFVSSRRLPSYSPVHAVLDRVAAAIGRLAPTVRASPAVRGRSLPAYVALELGKWTLLALASVAAFLQVIELVERGDEFFERGMGLADIARYAFLRLPATLQLSVPIAALAGAMAGFSSLASAREMIAMRAAGTSQWRILAMAAPVALALAAGTFALAEWAAPATQLRLASWWSATEPASDERTERARWFRIEGALVRAGTASADGRRLGDVRIFERDAHGRLDRRIAAERAVHSADGWSLSGVEVVRFAGGTLAEQHPGRLQWDVPLQPDDVVAFFTAAPVQSAASALRSLENAAPVDRSEAVFATRIHRSAAEPFAPLVMLLLALPLAFVAPRTGRAWPALLYAGLGGLVYLVADGVLTVAGQVGYLPPVVGAWAAPVLGLLVGIEVLLTTER